MAYSSLSARIVIDTEGVLRWCIRKHGDFIIFIFLWYMRKFLFCVCRCITTSANFTFYFSCLCNLFVPRVQSRLLSICFCFFFLRTVINIYIYMKGLLSLSLQGFVWLLHIHIFLTNEISSSQLSVFVVLTWPSINCTIATAKQLASSSSLAISGLGGKSIQGFTFYCFLLCS